MFPGSQPGAGSTQQIRLLPSQCAEVAGKAAAVLLPCCRRAKYEQVVKTLGIRVAK